MGLTGVITDATIRLPAGRDVAASCATPSARVDVDDCMDRMISRRRRLPVLGRLDRLPRTRQEPRPRGAHARQPRDARRAPGQGPRDRARSTRPQHCSRGSAVDAERSRQLRSRLRAFNELWFRKAPRGRRRHSSASCRSSSRSTGSPAGTASTARAGSCSTSSSSRTAPNTSFASHSNGCSAAHCRRSSRSSSASSTTADRCSASRNGAGPSRSTSRAKVPISASLLDGLDELVVAAGGRVVSDERLTRAARNPGSDVPASCRSGAKPRGALDPHDVLHSDMDRRLGLRGTRGATR